MHRIQLHSVLLTAVLMLPAVASAHGDAHAPKAGPVRKEQKDWGIAAEPRAARRTITVVLSDQMRFTPDKLVLRVGDTVRMVFRNEGKMLHEFVMGTKKELAEHAALMLKFPDMEHDEPYMAHVPAGKTGTIVWTFNRAGEFDFACLVAGHYQAGMVGSIMVRAK